MLYILDMFYIQFNLNHVSKSQARKPAKQKKNKQAKIWLLTNSDWLGRKPKKAAKTQCNWKQRFHVSSSLFTMLFLKTMQFLFFIYIIFLFSIFKKEKFILKSTLHLS